jgi:hypothetical protein
MLARNIEARVYDPVSSDDRLVSRLRATCAIAIEAYGKAPIEKQLAILMLVYRIQDHIARARNRDLLSADPPGDGWVDAWKPN